MLNSTLHVRTSQCLQLPLPCKFEQPGSEEATLRTHSKKEYLHKIVFFFFSTSNKIYLLPVELHLSHLFIDNPITLSVKQRTWCLLSHFTLQFQLELLLEQEITACFSFE